MGLKNCEIVEYRNFKSELIIAGHFGKVTGINKNKFTYKIYYKI